MYTALQGSGFRVQGSGKLGMRNEGGGFAANIYGAIRMGRYEKNVVAPRSAFWLSKFKETWNDGASHKI